MPEPEPQTSEIVSLISNAITAKKGADVRSFDVSQILGVVEAFVITDGSNPRQVKTIAENVEFELNQQTGISPIAVEGLDQARWVLLDYGFIAVHVFLDEVRQHYRLERLFADQPEFQAADAH